MYTRDLQGNVNDIAGRERDVNDIAWEGKRRGIFCVRGRFTGREGDVWHEVLYLSATKPLWIN